MSVFFAVFDRQKSTVIDTTPPKGVSTVAEQNEEKVKYDNGDVVVGPVETARVVKVEGTAVADVQQAINQAFPGNVAGTTVVVTEAQFKTS